MSEVTRSIVITDYGVGNLASIQNMLKKAGYTASISSDPSVIEQADKLILPGVGAFDACAGKLRQSGLVPVLNKKVLEQKTPVLGICVGMQLLLEGSEEGTERGLAWLSGTNIRFRQEGIPNMKVPHMGWTDVIPERSSPLLNDMFEEPRFYFVHSYHAQLNDKNDMLLRAHHGYDFPASVAKGNIMGVQFHPEKSHKFGMKLLGNFAKNDQWL